MAEFQVLPNALIELINQMAFPCPARARIYVSGEDILSPIFENLSVIKAIAHDDDPDIPESRLIFAFETAEILMSQAKSDPCHARLDLSIPRDANEPAFRVVLDGRIEVFNNDLTFFLNKGHYFFQRPGRVMPPQESSIALSLFDSYAGKSMLGSAIVLDLSESGVALLVNRKAIDLNAIPPGSSWGIRLTLEPEEPVTFRDALIVRTEMVKLERLTAVQMQQVERQNISFEDVVKVAIAMKDPNYSEYIKPVLKSWLAQDPSTGLPEHEPLAVLDFIRRQLTGSKG